MNRVRPIAELRRCLMRRAGMLLSLLVAVLLVAGCSAMFDFNLFKDLGLDPVAAPTPADYAGAGGLDRLAADLASPAMPHGGVLAFVFGARTLRAVTHLDVSAAQCERAAQVLAELI